MVEELLLILKEEEHKKIGDQEDLVVALVKPDFVKKKVTLTLLGKHIFLSKHFIDFFNVSKYIYWVFYALFVSNIYSIFRLDEKKKKRI